MTSSYPMGSTREEKGAAPGKGPVALGPPPYFARVSSFAGALWSGASCLAFRACRRAKRAEDRSPRPMKPPARVSRLSTHEERDSKRRAPGRVDDARAKARQTPVGALVRGPAPRHAAVMAPQQGTGPRPSDRSVFRQSCASARY